MSYDRHRALIRRAIAIGLLIWLLGQALAYLQPYGVPALAATSLAVAGVGALPLIMAWPWIRRRWLHAEDERRDESAGQDQSYRTLVTVEVALLSAVLMVLLMWMPV